LGDIYKVWGHGAEAMTGVAHGTELDVLTGLGNGYDVSRSGEHPLLVGGGAPESEVYAQFQKWVQTLTGADRYIVGSEKGREG